VDFSLDCHVGAGRSITRRLDAWQPGDPFVRRDANAASGKGGTAMKFSLIVSTVGRVNDLHALFTSLAAQSYRDFEVIVVDQSGDDRLAELVSEYCSVFKLRHVPMQQRGVSRGRNRGLFEIGGEIVAFPDDDCAYPPDVLQRVSRLFDTDS